MSGLDKETLTEVKGIGEAYAEDILDVYSDAEEMAHDGIGLVSEKTGVPEGTVDKLFVELPVDTDDAGEVVTDEEGKEVDHIENETSYAVIHYEDGTTELDEDGGDPRWRDYP